MEKQHNHDYGQFDPDYIEQNTLVGGTYSNEDEYKQVLNQDNKEFGESDPDHYEQNTLVDNDNYARDEDPYQYQEEFVEDLSHPEQDFEKNSNVKAENIPNEERVVNEDDAITNDATEEDLKDQYDSDHESIENNNDAPENLNDFDAEHYPENHPRE